MSTVRMALAQTAWNGDRESTADQLEQAVREAARLGAGLIGFPELCTSPYFCTEPHGQFDWAFEPIPEGPTSQRMSALAKELNVVLVVPLAEQDVVGRRYNTAAVIDTDGSVAGIYRKRHLPHSSGSWERAYFHPGNIGPSVFPTAAGRVGVGICWDRYFPDTWHKLATEQAEIVVIPIASNTPAADRKAVLIQPAAAFLHTMFVATVNRVDPGCYSGGSYVATPLGEILEAFGSKHEEVVLRDIDLGQISRAKQSRYQ